MRVMRDGNKLILEDRPLVLPAVLAGCTALMAFRLVQWTLEHGWTSDNIGFAFGVALMLIFTILTAGASRFTFDKSMGRLSWKRRTFLRNYSGNVPLGDVQALFLDSMTDSEGDLTWRGVISLADGRGIPVAAAFSPDREKWESVQESVRQFLGLEEQDDGIEPQVRRLLQANRKVEAIKLVRLETGSDLTTAKTMVDRMADGASG